MVTTISGPGVGLEYVVGLGPRWAAGQEWSLAEGSAQWRTDRPHRR